MKHSIERLVVEVLIGLSTIVGGVKIAETEIVELAEHTVKITERIKKVASGSFDPEVFKNQVVHQLETHDIQQKYFTESVDPVESVKDKLWIVMNDNTYRKTLTPTQLDAFATLYHALDPSAPKP